MRALLLLLALVSALLAIHAHAAFINRRRFDGALNMGLEAEEHDGLLLSSSSLNATDDGRLWYTQRVNHFDPTCTQTYQQRYYVNSTHYKRGGPVFLSIGGEGSISARYVSGAFITNEYAAKHNALILALEHRFYGVSMPKPTTSTENLRYLTTDLALADLAAFREFIMQSWGLPKETRWIVFGGSYPGMLSSWARVRFPHLFHGSVASSAPVLAQLDFPEYLEVVQQAMGARCAAVVRRATDIMHEMLETPQGKAKLVSRFNACSPIVSQDDAATFFSAIVDTFAEVVQYSGNNRASKFDVSKMCAKLLEKENEPLEAVAEFVAAANGPECLTSNYQHMVADFANSAMRAWMWQVCTEYGYLQTTSSAKQPFSRLITLDWFLKQCVDLFGIPGQTPRISWSNSNFGAMAIQPSNTVFTNGRIDPWHILSPTKHWTNEDSAVLFMEGTAHCADLYASRETDLPELKKVRQVTANYLQVWLNQKDKRDHITNQVIFE